MTATGRDIDRFAGGAGAIAAIGAALCCAGAPIILIVLSAAGLSFLRTDAILFPIIAISLAVAIWGFWRRRRIHKSSGPLALAVVGSFALVAGVVFLHGRLAKVCIGVGTLALIAATIWNARLPHACEVPVANAGTQRVL